jgi:hypothetical protein
MENGDSAQYVLYEVFHGDNTLNNLRACYLAT